MILVLAQRKLDEVKRCFRSRKTLLVLTGSTIALAINWLTFIFAVSRGYVLQASLGYFITPLMNVMMGMALFKERLRPWQAISFLIAAAGVLNITIRAGEFPWIAVLVALSFSTYGLLRKTMPIGALVGTTVETTLLLPLALIVMALQIRFDVTRHSFDGRTYAILLCAGIVTAVPLLAFVAAARRLRLATLGILQYLAPTGQFLLAVFAFGEPFKRYQLVSFLLIWIALAMYTVDSLIGYRAKVQSIEARDCLLSS
jgi:chloramphenicol-sensitive protein RarD